MDDPKDFIADLLVERDQLRAALARMQRHANMAEQVRRDLNTQVKALRLGHEAIMHKLLEAEERLEDVQNAIASRHIDGQTEYETILQICQDLDEAEKHLRDQGFCCSRGLSE